MSTRTMSTRIPSTVRGRRWAAAVLLAGIVFAACGDDTSVGSGVDTDFEQEAQDALGATTTTAAPAATTTAPPTTAATQRSGGGQGQSQATTTTAPTRTADIAVTASGYEPPVLRVYLGTDVIFTNRDSEPRGATADNGAFDTGLLSPGQTFTFTPTVAGKVNYSDPSRPFVTGTLEVV